MWLPAPAAAIDLGRFDLKRLDSPVQRADVDAQVPGGVLSISFAALERFGDQKPLHRLKAHWPRLVATGG